MIDRELLLRKLDSLRHHRARLGARLPETAEVLLQDEDLRDILSNNLCQAVQSAFDVVAHIIAHIDAKVPDTYAEGFEVLATAGVIAPTLARQLILASGLRNRLQHQYQTVDWRVVHASIRERVGDFDAFVGAIRTYLDSGDAGGR